MPSVDHRGPDRLITPIHVKTRPDMPLPDEEATYLLLANNGLWLCRNHPFFVSSVPARSWPKELVRHQSSLRLRHPKIPRITMERTVGFFGAVAERYGSEAGVLLAWDAARKITRLLVPQQTATVGRAFNGVVFPIGLHYEIPSGLPPTWSIIGDIHSHAYGAAYSSGQDQSDEEYRPGLHIVVGRVGREPPEFHGEYVVDGTRFKIDSGSVMEGYRARSSNVPGRWIRKVKLQDYGWNTA